MCSAVSHLIGRKHAPAVCGLTSVRSSSFRCSSSLVFWKFPCMCIAGHISYPVLCIGNLEVTLPPPLTSPLPSPNSGTPVFLPRVLLSPPNGPHTHQSYRLGHWSETFVATGLLEEACDRQGDPFRSRNIYRFVMDAELMVLVIESTG